MSIVTGIKQRRIQAAIEAAERWSLRASQAVIWGNLARVASFENLGSQKFSLVCPPQIWSP